MDMANAVRLWFYNDDILSWYDEFNAVRDRFFAERGIFDRLLPASTGVGGRNPARAALVAGAMAIQAKEDYVTMQEVLSPRQDPATEYGSSFSRAVEIAKPDHRVVLVSGTASIGADGKTVHIEDVDAQIALAMEVVEAIIVSRGMSYSDITRAVLYFKHAKDAPAFDAYCENHGLPVMPLVIIHGDICRHNLLFEIELDAISKTIEDN